MTANPDGAALLRAVCESPFDDTPRLVYADWLEENGGEVPCKQCGGQGWQYIFPEHDAPTVACPDCHGTGTVSDGRRERAELIRVQVELANPTKPCRGCQSTRMVVGCDPATGRITDDAPCPQCVGRLSLREQAMLRRYGEEWSEGICGTTGWDWWPHTFASATQWSTGDGPSWSFARGFVGQVKCKLSDWYGVRCGCDPVGSRLISTEDGYTWARCNRCDKGRVGGVGPKVVAIEPVTEVILGDVEPGTGTFQRADPNWHLQGRRFWIWHPEEHNTFAASHLPWAVYNHLTGSCSPYARQYLSREDAFAALSRALVDWARDKASLPKLEWAGLPVNPD